jgi:hypothetical protein
MIIQINEGYNPFKVINAMAVKLNGRVCYSKEFYNDIIKELKVAGIVPENEKEEAFLIEELFNMGII